MVAKSKRKPEELKGKKLKKSKLSPAVRKVLTLITTKGEPDEVEIKRGQAKGIQLQSQMPDKEPQEQEQSTPEQTLEPQSSKVTKQAPKPKPQKQISAKAIRISPKIPKLGM